MRNIPLRTKGTYSITVGPDDLASQMNAARPAVMATRVMVGMMELAAMDAVQPRVRKRASATRPSSKRADSRSMSPQAGLVTSTLTAGGASSPGLRGF